MKRLCILTVLVAAFGLGACGGGGGDSGPPPPPPIEDTWDQMSWDQGEWV